MGIAGKSLVVCAITAMAMVTSSCSGSDQADSGAPGAAGGASGSASASASASASGSASARAGTGADVAAAAAPACTAGAPRNGTPAPVTSNPTKSVGTKAGGALVKTTFPTLQGQPMLEPPIIRSTDGVLSTQFDTRKSKYVIAGREVTGMSYAGQFVGPTLWVDPGDTIKIDLTNSLSEDTNFHTHGVHTSPIKISDNIFRVMAPDSDNKVVIEVPKGIAPGTYWYHAHLHGLTEPQVFAGLAGTLVVTGLTERLPANLRGVPDHVLTLRDVQLKGNSIQTVNIDSNAPTTRTINGQVNPVVKAQPGCAQLLRLGNFSADIWYRLRLDGAKFSLLAEDANPMGKVTSVKEILLPPGKRFDVLVSWPKAGTYRLRTLRYQTGPAGDQYPARVLATFKVGGKAVKPVKLPKSMGPMPTLGKDKVAVRREVVFSENTKTNQFFINGKQFKDSKPMFVAKLGNTEEWTIRNVTKEEHPFHIHVNDFQVMSINGKAVTARSLQDTIRLPAGGKVVVRMRFEDYIGKYVFHCHILAHEDNGMMATIEVTQDGKPASEATAESWGQGVMPAMPGM